MSFITDFGVKYDDLKYDDFNWTTSMKLYIRASFTNLDK